MHPTEEAQLNFWRAVISLVPAPFADARAGGSRASVWSAACFTAAFGWAHGESGELAKARGGEKRC